MCCPPGTKKIIIHPSSAPSCRQLFHSWFLSKIVIYPFIWDSHSFGNFRHSFSNWPFLRKFFMPNASDANSAANGNTHNSLPSNIDFKPSPVTSSNFCLMSELINGIHTSSPSRLIHASIWKAVSRCIGEKRTCHPLIIPNGAEYTEADKAEIFANCMEEQFCVHRGICDPVHLAKVSDFVSEYFSKTPPAPQPPSAEMTLCPFSITSTSWPDWDYRSTESSSCRYWIHPCFVQPLSPIMLLSMSVKNSQWSCPHCVTAITPYLYCQSFWR